MKRGLLLLCLSALALASGCSREHATGPDMSTPPPAASDAATPATPPSGTAATPSDSSTPAMAPDRSPPRTTGAATSQASPGAVAPRERCDVTERGRPPTPADLT